jgi:hypothetical protein
MIYMLVLFCPSTHSASLAVFFQPSSRRIRPLKLLRHIQPPFASLPLFLLHLSQLYRRLFIVLTFQPCERHQALEPITLMRKPFAHSSFLYNLHMTRLQSPLSRSMQFSHDCRASHAHPWKKHWVQRTVRPLLGFLWAGDAWA